MRTGQIHSRKSIDLEMYGEAGAPPVSKVKTYRSGSKEYLNSSQASFRERRNKQWTDVNWRPKNEWVNHER